MGPYPQWGESAQARTSRAMVFLDTYDPTLLRETLSFSPLSAIVLHKVSISGSSTGVGLDNFHPPGAPPAPGDGMGMDRRTFSHD